MASIHDLVVLVAHKAIMTASGHQQGTLAGQQAVLHAEMVVGAAPTAVGIGGVNVVHHRRQVHGKAHAVFPVVRGRGHEPRPVDGRRRTGVHLPHGMRVGVAVVMADVHLPGAVVDVNARDVVV